MLINKPSLSAQEIVKLNKEYTFFSWSVQSYEPNPDNMREGYLFLGC
jgi:hypothetical protein